MKKFLQKKLNQKGLTLVELLAVIVILGIIAAIAVPAIGNIIENTKYNAVKADALNAINAANLYYAEEPTVNSITVKKLVEDGYMETRGKLAEIMTVDRKQEGDKKTLSVSGTSEAYVTGKTVTFTKGEATVDAINADKQKGSKGSSKTIPGSQPE